MRIEAYNQVQAVYQAQQASKVSKVSNVTKTDKVSISSFGKDIQTAKAALSNIPDVREDVVANLKAKIDNGTYNVSPESFADKLIAKYNSL